MTQITPSNNLYNPNNPNNPLGQTKKQAYFIFHDTNSNNSNNNNNDRDNGTSCLSSSPSIAPAASQDISDSGQVLPGPMMLMAGLYDGMYI